MPPFESNYEAGHGAGVPDTENIGEDYAPRHGVDVNLIRAIEDAVPDGFWDGVGVLLRLRAAGFDVVRKVVTA